MLPLQVRRILDSIQVNEDDAHRISLVILCNGIILASTKAMAIHLTTMVCGGVCVVAASFLNLPNAADF